MRRAAALITLAGLVAAAVGARASAPPTCESLRPDAWLPASGVADDAGDVRVYAIQFKQEIRHAESHAAFDRKMRCLIEDLVLPTADADGDGRADGVTIVVLNEDAGLATIAAGTRNAPARAFAAYGPKDPENIPGALGAFATLAVTSQPAISYYAAREPETSPQRLILAAATDGFVRGFMRTNSEIARDYGVYVVSSNNQAEFRETSDPVAVAALADPDRAADHTGAAIASVFEAVDVDEPLAPAETVGMGRAGIDVYNQAWMWAPVDAPAGHPVRTRYESINGGPLSAVDPRRNIIHVTRKTPLTQIELDTLDLSDDRDVSQANTGPFCLLEEWDAATGCDGATIRIGYGISLPSFQWGTRFGIPLPEGTDPCGGPHLWMRCLDARGVNLFLQPEANPAMWSEYIDRTWDPLAFQALSWLDSAWRAVADPTVSNIRYAVTPHIVGNLVDLTFDGQSVIFERCSGPGDPCAGNMPATFVGAAAFLPCGAGQTSRCDDPALQPYAGLHRETLVLAPWVAADDPGFGPGSTQEEVVANRDRLAAISRALQAGSGSPLENAYLETAVWADLAFDANPTDR